MKNLLVILSLFFLIPLHSFSLKDKIIKGKEGDYVVIEQGKMASCLLIRKMSLEHILFEEITIPSLAYPPKDLLWKEWIHQGAPGHTAWTSYLINIKTDELEECYSHSEQTWFSVKDPNHFLPQLLKLPLYQSQEADRKKIGPPPLEGEKDHRSLWHPPLIVEGQKIEKPSITTWVTKWPSDESLMANSDIEMYFSSLAFPVWIEVKIPHYKVNLRSIDIGHGIKSPQPIVFKRSLQFKQLPTLSDDALSFTIESPSYYAPVKVFAVLVSSKREMIEIGTIPFHHTSFAPFSLSRSSLSQFLIQGERYQIALKPSLYPHLITYSPSFFDL
ncbi:hypothetical protein [Rhabdochlamydiaceae symbiont of Dictyostelium giganteum]|uniref:hypothetical protein n=1 Tax=Rhabdochlamydiaceae symbiont of Dictyostelium giganteum TaxID=3342349 RepID=UPI00384ABC27